MKSAIINRKAFPLKKRQRFSSLSGAPKASKGDLVTSADVEKIAIGRLNVFDAPLTAELSFDARPGDKQADIFIKNDKCIRLEKARLTLNQQDMDSRFSNASLCGGETPFFSIDWNDETYAEFSGVLSAENVRHRLGRTRINGRPPSLPFTGVYKPVENNTVINGDVAGGGIVINNNLFFSDAQGKFDFSLDKETMRATISE